MIIKGILHYEVDRRHAAFLQKKLFEFIDGFVMQNVLGALTDMFINERKFERTALDNNTIEITIDTFGVDLEEDESDEVEMALRESFASVIDSPFMTDNEEVVFMKETEMIVRISVSDSGGD